MNVRGRREREEETLNQNKNKKNVKEKRVGSWVSKKIKGKMEILVSLSEGKQDICINKKMAKQRIGELMRG